MDTTFLNEQINYIYLHEDIKNIALDQDKVKDIVDAIQTKSPKRIMRAMKGVPAPKPSELNFFGKRKFGSSFTKYYEKSLKEIGTINAVSMCISALYAVLMIMGDRIKDLTTAHKLKKTAKEVLKGGEKLMKIGFAATVYGLILSLIAGIFTPGVGMMSIIAGTLVSGGWLLVCIGFAIVIINSLFTSFRSFTSSTIQSVQWVR